MKKTFIACFSLAACVAFADTVTVTQEFSSATAQGWTLTGGGTSGITTAHTGDVSVGSPLATNRTTFAIESTETVLLVTGTVYYADADTEATDQYAESDFLFFAEQAGDCPTNTFNGKMTDDLTTFGGDFGSSLVSLATGPALTDGKSEVWVWTVHNNATNWYPTGTEIATGAWHRVSIKYDFTNNVSQVNVDGMALISDYGWAAATNRTYKGSWYLFAESPTADKNLVRKLGFIGATEVDKVRLAYGIVEEPIYVFYGGVTTNGTTVTYDYLARHSLSVEQAGATVADGSGMLVSSKFEAGLTPYDKLTFTAQSIDYDAANNMVLVTIPFSEDNGQTYTVSYSVDGGDYVEQTDEVVIAETNEEEHTRTLRLPNPSAAYSVLRIQIKSTINPLP